jgi:thiosulfate/3-mercaptopyruvate sulfurtransferase
MVEMRFKAYMIASLLLLLVSITGCIQNESDATSFASVLTPLNDVNSSGIILDISPNATEYIPGAINIPYNKFLEKNGVLKPASEMTDLLGEAGISADDELLIYGECQPCGGGPSAATYVYWIMKYLGHEKLRLMEGGIEDWIDAGHPTSAKPINLTRTNYIPTAINAGLLATFDYVHNNATQIIDARSVKEFEKESIPNSINIPYDRVLDEKRIKNETALQELFSSFDKARPVVVYTNTGLKATMTWFVLTLLGYDAKIYSWYDWKENQNSSTSL